MQRLLWIFFLTGLFFCQGSLLAQVGKDSSKIKTDSALAAKAKDSIVKKKFNPRTATLRSAILPGWGQVYNKKYWKLPLVYGALGTTAGVFFYNIKTYKILRLAYNYKTDKDSSNDVLIDDRFKNFSAAAIKTNRDLFRQNVDYSVLFFIVFWGLNVIDATVDGQLKEFDVNENLSLQIHPGYSEMAKTNGISLVLDIHSPRKKSSK